MTKMKDGFKTLVEFSLDDNIQLYETSVKVPGLSAGGPIDTTTMRNVRNRTMCPKSLITTTQLNITGGWNPELYNEMEAMVGVNQEISIVLPTEDTIIVWGWIDSFEPSPLEEGEFPTVDLVVEISNQNDDEVPPTEQGPILFVAGV